MLSENREPCVGVGAGSARASLRPCLNSASSALTRAWVLVVIFPPWCTLPCKLRVYVYTLRIRYYYLCQYAAPALIVDVAKNHGDLLPGSWK